ncbi:hypothetical protein QQS21_011202 [Conoideocrella luteorostrata]|uniref:Rhodopsin domain-containing protein n=1 Tax=Conoideocrella luteorostrata TaxID=1105319 RepID=A0AAJ0CDQ0_9HYPO|nr:hypothetical protein QQS21_011202 [Conoideocrella luteorostrata]
MAPAQNAVNLFIWAIVFTPLDIFFVGLRFWAARLVRRKISADDYLIVLSMITTLALESVMIWGIFNGMGMRSSDLAPEQLSVQLQLIPATYVTWTVATTTFKLSVLFLYIRIMSWPMVKRLSYILMGLTLAYCITFMAVFVTTCSPDLSQLWNPRPDGHCRDLNIGQLGSVSTNLALDVLIIALPMPFLWSLKMRTRNKVVVITAFSLGFITIAIMIWRIQRLVSTGSNPKADFVQDLPVLALTTTLELWLCIIIACIPTIGPIIKTYVKPVIKKLTGHATSEEIPRTQIQRITFGRGHIGGRRRGEYTDLLGSHNLTRDDIEAHQQSSSTSNELVNIRKDIVMTRKTSTGPNSGENLRSFSVEVKADRQTDVRQIPAQL